MEYINRYDSPLGPVLIAADEAGVTGLWFEGQKYYAHNLDNVACEKETDVIASAKRWLDVYFAGDVPDFKVPLSLRGGDFQMRVWRQLQEIPYGSAVTYGQLAGVIASQLGRDRMSAQAIGGAVGRNPVAIIVPCHRVLGARGRLTGYAGGIDKKVFLLELEGIHFDI